MKRQQFGPKQIALIALVSLTVVAMGVLYVRAGSVMEQVPKTEAVKAPGGIHREIASGSTPSFSTLAQAHSGSAVQPAEGDGPAVSQTESTATNENASDTDNSKRNNPLANALRSAKAKFRQ